MSDPTESLAESRLSRLSTPDLVSRLRGADSAARLLIGDALSQRAGKDSGPLIEALTDTDWHVRWGAAHALGKSRTVGGAPALRLLLGDPQPRVARTAAWALGRVRDAEAVPLLARAVHSSNSRLSAAAAWALGHIGAPEATAALVDALDSAGTRAFRSISLAFAEIGPEASQALVGLLRNGSTDERTRAARILARFGDHAAALLLPLLTSADVKHRRAAAHILGTLRLGRPETGKSAGNEDDNAAAGGDDGDGDSPDDTGNEDLRMQIERALLDALDDDDLRVRLSAARSLGSLGVFAARPALERMLAGTAEEVRGGANALAVLGDPAAADALREALNSHLSAAQPAGPTLVSRSANHQSIQAIERALAKLGLAPARPRPAPPAVNRKDLPTKHDYLAMVTPGLEMVAWEEIAGRLNGARLKTFDDGAVVFQWKGSPQACAILRSVRRVFQGGADPAEIPLARRLRRYRVKTLPASLEPTTAYNIARLANLGERDVFADVTCGSGTIAFERLLDGPARAVLAGDIDPEAIAAAAANAEAGSQPVRLVLWDAAQLPLASHSLNAIAANLPYGRRSGSHAANTVLYPAILAEAGRVLRQLGTAVLLTTEKRLMRESIEKQSVLHLVSERDIDADGLKPGVYILQKE